MNQVTGLVKQLVSEPRIRELSAYQDAGIAGGELRRARRSLHESISFYFTLAVQRGLHGAGSGLHIKCKTPLGKSGACKSWGRKEDLPMILLVLIVILLLLRTRKTRLKFEIEL
jgi:hypothetical protein